MRGYYEANRAADLLGIPVSVMAINVMVNGVHWHDHAEILYCIRGEMHVRIDGQAYDLREGDFVTVDGGISHEIFDGEPGNMQIICSVDRKMLGNMEGKSICCSTLGDGIAERDAVSVRQALSEMTYLSMADLQTAEQKGEAKYRDRFVSQHPLRKEENWNAYHMYMYQLLTVLVKYKVDGKRMGERKHELIDSCTAYINSHIGETLNAKILAREMHVSESTIYRLFSEQVGTALNHYITVLRLHAACRCLEETTEKVSAVAYGCGFTGLSNFYRVFQKYVGMTPKDYRSSRQHAGTRLRFREPDIMKLNCYQNFQEFGITKEIFTDMCRCGR